MSVKTVERYAARNKNTGRFININQLSEFAIDIYWVEIEEADMREKIPDLYENGSSFFSHMCEQDYILWFDGPRPKAEDLEWIKVEITYDIK